MTAVILQPELALNREQNDAATIVDRHLCVEAGAGSGKTRVLVARMVGLLAPGVCALNELAAITFTRKAAGEMRERLRKAFRERANSTDTAEQNHWRDLIRRLETARINTIDGFCASLLREHAVRLGIDPDFSVLDESESLQLRQELAQAEVLRLLDEGHAAARRYAVEHGVSALVGCMTTLLQSCRAVDAAASARPLHNADALAEEWRRWADADLKERIRRCAAEYGYADALARFEAAAGRCTDAGDKFEENRVVLVGALRVLLSDPSRDAAASAFAAIDSCRRNAGSKKNWPDQELLFELREIASRVKDGVEKFGASAPDPDTEARAAAMTVDLYAVFTEVVGEYREQKRRIGAMDFEDLLARTVAAVRDDAELRAELRATFKHILVDEFQDTDPMQFELIGMLRNKEGDPGPVVFIVGDVKQAIYGFRGADVTVFDDAKAQAQQVVPLPRNYRSDAAIIEFVNDFYRTSGLLSTGGRVYDALDAHRPHTDHATVTYLVPEAAEHRLTADEERYREAELAADRIHAMCNGGAQVLHKSEYRPAGWGDVAILFRKRTAIPAYERVLRERGIPFVIEQGRGYFDRQEVHDLVNLLTVVSNPWNEVALIGFLRSPLAALSDESLMRLTATKPLAQTFYSEVALPGAEQQERLERARTLVRRCQSMRHAPVSELLQHVFEATGFESAQLALHHSVQRANNVRQLLDTADRISESSTPDLRAFIRFVSDVHAYELVESEAPWIDPEGGTVTLMTVHKSKGLEFPIVLLADTGRTPSRGRHDVPMVFDRRFGLASAVEDREGGRAKPLIFEIAADAEKQRELEEESRILYVAMTRAKDHLLIAGSPKPAKDSWLQWHDETYGVMESPDGHEIRAGRTIVRVVRTSEGLAAPAEAVKPRETLDTAVIVAAARPVEVSAIPRESIGVHELLNLLEPDEAVSTRAEPSSGAIDPALRGQIAHRLFELWDPNAGNAPDYDAVLGPFPLDDEQLARMRTELDECRARFESSPLRAWMKASPIAKRELPFIAPIGGVMLRGVVDALLEDGTLVDYKTGGSGARNLRRYTRQLHLYSWALRRIDSALAGRAALYFIDAGELREIDVSDAAIAETAAAAEEALSARVRSE